MLIHYFQDNWSILEVSQFSHSEEKIWNDSETKLSS